MGKTGKLFLALVALVLLLQVSPALQVTAIGVGTQGEVSLEEHLIGTWRWETSSSWLVIFREDGTMLDGPPGLRTIYQWQIVNGRLMVDGVDWNLRIGEDSITLDRYGRNIYRYVWYSDATEGDTSFWLIWVILAVIVLIIVVPTVLITRIIVRRKNRKKQEPLL